MASMAANLGRETALLLGGPGAELWPASVRLLVALSLGISSWLVLASAF